MARMEAERRGVLRLAGALGAIAALCAAVAAPALAQTLAVRDAAAAGTIVAARGGEELQLVSEAIWRPALVRQNLVAGDTLRTGAAGNLAILFADATQIRVGRNSTLVVKSVTAPVTLALPAGAIWARANRGGGGVTIEAPAATAAVRGTDWSLAVAPDGRTALAVFDGTVEFYNAQGRVSVAAGEAAVASIGGPPTKTVLVNPNDREQMLFYLELRGGFAGLPPSPLGRRAMREARARILATPAEQMGIEDALALAEIAFAIDGPAAAAGALHALADRRLAPAQQARADLVAALLAGMATRYAEAASLFEAALPRLDGRRRVSALYGRFFAQALADPSRRVAPPSADLARTDPYAALAQAWIVGFVDGPAAAIEVLREAEKRFPDAILLPAMRADLAQLLDRRDEMRAAAARAKAIDPEDPAALLAEADVASYLDRNLERSLVLAREATIAAPSDAGAWNEVGIAESAREADREAERAFFNAVAADPANAAAHLNYGYFLLDKDRPREARAPIERALALDPSFAAAHAALGRYYMQVDEVQKGVESLREATTIDPADSAALRDLAAALYENGDVEGAVQQIGNAKRLDENDPLAYVIASIFAMDHYEADQAIENTREAMRRYRERGDYYSGTIAFSRKAGSYLADPYRMLGLNAWGRYYGDIAFDPFDATGYFDQSLAEAPSPIVSRGVLDGPDLGLTPASYSRQSLIQGLTLGPLSVSARNRWTDIFRRPFFDTDVGGGLVVREGGAVGWSADATVQGFSNEATPTSYFLNVGGLSSPGDGVNNELRAGSMVGFLGANPTPFDRLVAFAVLGHDDPPLPGQRYFPTPRDDQKSSAADAGVAWSHTFEYHNVLTAAVSATGSSYETILDRGRTRPGDLFRQTLDNREMGVSAALSHMVEIAGVTFQTGVEGGTASGRTRIHSRDIYPGYWPSVVSIRDDYDVQSALLYIDARATPMTGVQVEGGLFNAAMTEESNQFDPRIGIAVTPFEGHWLRAAYRQDAQSGTGFSLAPVTTLGLTPAPLPVSIGGAVETTAVRWDAEWMDRLFTALEYQHQDVNRLNLEIPRSLSTFRVAQGRLDRLMATVNIWVGNGLGAFATYTYTDSEKTSRGQAEGAPLPLVPDHLATVGLTYVNPLGFDVTLSETYVGERVGWRDGTMVPGYWSTDVQATWVSPQRHIEFNLSLFNIFDEDYDLAGDVAGPGRTFLATLRAKF